MPLKLTICLIMALCLAGQMSAMVPPHPQMEQVPAGFRATRLELPPGGISASAGSRTVPNDIIVLRVQFSDVQFQATPEYPDYLAHDGAFFDRWMLHLSDFFADASHYLYELNYTLHPSVFTLPQTMGYYGADDAATGQIDARLDQFTLDLMAQADPAIDFSQYGGVIVFHAGAGQESDISRLRPEQIWSTFLTRKRLQYWFDEENDAYPGLATDDGAILTNIVIVPEHEFQDYFPGPGEPGAEVYLFSIYGVLAHQFGHILGLPSLFDNDSSNGVSQGIGNWGLMGTGIWNASGYVPAQLSPWCRVFLGWEPFVTVTQSSEDLIVDHFLDHLPFRNRLFKVPISDREYFLIENRQQNPDASVDPYTGQPSYSFKLLPEGEQDYYENYPLLPYFNFMENRYIGSEWDFMLPGLGGPIPMGMTIPVDGSGLLIWHIDENVIAANFTPNFDLNTINAHAPHKGIDVEEADGIQHLDTAAPDQYKWGSPYDTFRADNNAYFGYQTHNGLLSLPTAESYYGGIPLEIYDISASGNQMAFSVRFGWRLSSNYEGENPINACIVDFEANGSSQIVYPMPDGQIYFWNTDGISYQEPLSRQPMEHTYVWTGQDFWFPMQLEHIARLYRLGAEGGEYVYNFNDQDWATHPLYDGESLYLALNAANGQGGRLYRHDPGQTGVHALREFEYPIVSNLALFRDRLYIPSHQGGNFAVWNYNLDSGEFLSKLVDVPIDSTLVGIFKAPILPGSQNGELVVQCLNSVYLFRDIDTAPQLVPGFPYVHDMRSTAPLTIADWDFNGSLDLILTSDQGIAVIDYSGKLMSPPSLNLAASDSLAFSSGALVLDLDNDGKNELIGSFSFNRLNAWEDNFRTKAGYPVSFGSRSRGLPLIGTDPDGITYAWVASDNGALYRQPLPDIVTANLDQSWASEYANLQRTASRDHSQLPNIFQSESLFVAGELYIYPNPLKSIYENKLTLNVMTNRDTPIEIRIFDINGSLVYKQKGEAKAYLRNREAIEIPAEKLRSGVYIAVVSGDRASRQLKFAVEK
ncbi:MAG: T9SS type A sorting domain-containing protein [Candidatus Syntrophosphaera sp.]|nr:T9SS type A sorting domain-containing protein [Candidatus Syntrophosphaera sp.]